MGKFINFVKYEEFFQTLKNLSERGFVWSDGSAAETIPDVIRLVQSDVILIINPKMKCVDYILDVMTPTSIMQTA